MTEIIEDAADQTLSPPERLSVSEAAQKYRYLNNPGSYVGPWRNETAPYLMEPMDVLASRDFNACVFVGPAQSGKTDALLLNWITYSVACDPADMLIIEKSQAASRDFSRRRIDRLHRYSEAVGKRLIKRRDSDNTFDKLYSSGMILTLSYPAINELSGRPIPRVALTDYDRMPADIDHEGSPFDLGRKRTTTYRSFAMTLAESSPGFSVEDTRALPQSPHEAPPCQGILSLYNRGDRRRWVWPCPFCKNYFEGDFDHLVYNDSIDLVERAESARMCCPQCKTLIDPGFKYDMNQQGVWLRDREKINREGQRYGTPVRSDIGSFWLKGTAAAFVSWKGLVLNYLKAYEEFERTGSEEALKTTTNTDQGKPYVSRGSETLRLPEDIKARAEPLGERVVPEGVRFLLATVDIQKSSFVVQVFGVGRGGDLWLVDRFRILKSKRLDDDGERFFVKPGSYLEDWDLIKEQVIDKTYPLGDGSGRVMRIKFVGSDSGGKAGVTNNAYDFWRKLRKAGEGDHKRFWLIKGDPTVGAPRVRMAYPDSSTNKGLKQAGARGEIPVLMMNVNVLKDRLNAMLDNTKPESGLIHFADWLEDDVFQELTVEQRTPKGWENPKGYRNEAWDLFTYCVGLCVEMKIDSLNWETPPGWADVWDKNSLVSKVEVQGEAQAAFVPKKKEGYDLAALAQQLA